MRGGSVPSFGVEENGVEENMDREIQIESGGKRVELNQFSHRVVVNTILGLVGSLHDVDPNAELRIVVKPASPQRKARA